MSNVSLINGHIDEDDLWEFIGDDTYKCRKCETRIYVEDYRDLPPYCKECEKWE